jgi:hypothetical protein
VSSYAYQPFQSTMGATLSLATAALMLYYIVTTTNTWMSTHPSLLLENYDLLDPDFRTVPRPFAVKWVHRALSCAPPEPHLKAIRCMQRCLTARSRSNC